MSKPMDFSSGNELSQNEERRRELFSKAVIELGEVFSDTDLKAFEMIQEICDDSYYTYSSWISLYNKKTLTTPDQVKSTFSKMMIDDLSVGRAVRELGRGFIDALMDYVYLAYGVRVQDFRTNFYSIIQEVTYMHLDYVSILKVFISTLDDFALQSENVLNTQAIIDIKNDLSDLMHNDSKGNFNVVHRDKQVVFNFKVLGTKDGQQILKMDKAYPVLRALLCFNSAKPILKADVIGEYEDIVGDNIGIELPLNPAYTVMWFKINKSGSITANFYTKSYAEQFFNMWCQRRSTDISRLYTEKERIIKIKQHTAFVPRADIEVYDVVEKEDGTRDILTMLYWEYYFSSKQYMPVVDLETGLKKNIVDFPTQFSAKHDVDCEYDEGYDDEDTKESYEYDEDGYDEDEYDDDYDEE